MNHQSNDDHLGRIEEKIKRLQAEAARIKAESRERDPPPASADPGDYFPDTVGQDALKRELFETYIGALKAGIPMKHGLLLSSPGMGKSLQFVPGIARMTGFTMVEPVGVSRNMKLDDLVLGKGNLASEVTMITAAGERPMIVLEEIGNIGQPNIGRLLTWLSEGWFTLLTGEKWDCGKPGVDWFLIATANDDGRFPPALSRRLRTYHFDPYTDAELAEVGRRFASEMGRDLSNEELLLVARDADPRSPSEMIDRVAVMLGLEAIGQEHDAGAVIRSMRLDKDGCNAAHRRTIVALHDLGDQSAQGDLARKVGTKLETVRKWIGELVEKDFLYPVKSGPGGGCRLTLKGIRKAVELKAGR